MVYEHIKAHWFKYLLETMVIVVGVLGAFALNHWNDSRIRQGTEEEVLEQIKLDLQRTLESVQESSSDHAWIIKSCKESLDHMAGDEPFDEEVAYLLAGSFFYTQVDNALAGYKTMQSHGVDIVTNSSLRNQIIHHFEGKLSTMKRRERILFDFADKVKLEEAQKYFEYTFGVEGYMVDGESATSWAGIRLRSEPRDYEVLRGSEEYRYHLRTYMETVKWYDIGVQVFGQETAMLIELINAELTSR